MAFVGQLVNIDGVDGPISPVDEIFSTISSAEKVEVNGRFGRVVAVEEDDKYIVHLSTDLLVRVAGDNLKPSNQLQLPYRDGGFDLMWPSSHEDLPIFGYEVSAILAQKGWCLVECISGLPAREEAWDQARSLPGFFSPQPEILPDYFGKGGSGKMTYLEEPTLDQLDDGRPFPDVLLRLDGELSYICEAMAPISPEMMGFTTAGRRSTVVWLPFDNREEAMQLRGQPLTEEDVEDGVVERHLSFIRERKVGFLRMVDNEGGELAIVPREDVIDAKPAKIPISPNKLFIYRADLITFSYKPRPLTKSLVLSTWLLEEPPQITLHSLIGGLDANSEMIGITGESIPAPVGNRIHIMALAGRMAGDARSVENQWCVYSQGCDGFVRIRNTRFDLDTYCTLPGEDRIPGRSYVTHSSLMQDFDVFNLDVGFFGIREKDAMFMSPSQRILLEEGYNCLHAYGYTKSTVRGQTIPVYLGDTGSDFQPVTMALNEKMIETGQNWNGEWNHLGASPAISAARLSHTFGLTGPSSQIDTACSASLVAVQVAAVNLRRIDTRHQGRCHVGCQVTEALAMGISIQVGPQSFIGLCAGTMLSPVGRCHTFNDTADGYARGEGGITCFMKHSDNEDDVQNQWACIMGVAANQDGRSANLTAPNGPAQQACIAASMNEAGVTAREISIAECHGTGTALGDPIECGALRGAMEPRSNPVLQCSSKSHVGHLEANAGITGLLKCVQMMCAQAAPPNIHLAELNHNLNMDGFPAFFNSEMTETGLAAGLSGVSSFGFGGTNARADVWSRAMKGTRRTGVQHIDTSKIRHLQVMCPVTLGPIDYLTGEPVSSVVLSGTKHRADVLRDVLAPYDISRYVYNGGFRFRLVEALDAFEEDLPEKTTVKICGTWSGWQSMQSMERRGDNIYAFTMVLSETRYEKFFLCLNGDRNQLIYPAIKNASELIHVKGPDHKGHQPTDAHPYCWIIDGRDEEIPSGTVYQVFFKWGVLNKQVWWEQVSSELAPTYPPYQHRYSVIGSFSSERAEDMIASEDRSDTWEYSVRIGTRGSEHFYFCRDGDLEQAIYPARHRTLHMGVPVQGPDEYAEGRAWIVRGDVGDLVTLKLTVTDGQITVETHEYGIGCNVWENLAGWDRHHYYVLGSWNNWEPLPMIMDWNRPGVYRARVTFEANNTSFHDTTLRYMFRISMDGLSTQVYYPDCEQGNDATVYGKYVVSGPGPNIYGDKRWVLTAPQAGVTYEIIFNPSAADRRQIVTWFFVPPASEQSSGYLEN